jgi:hypothetical protein
MSEELAAIVYFQIYAPFAFALSLVSGFFWSRHLSTKRAITKIDDKVNEHITEFAVLKEGQKHHTKMLDSQTVILKEISENVANNNIATATIVATMERRSEVRSNNTPL